MSEAPAGLKLVEPQPDTGPRDPWFKFYPDAWLADELLTMCSMAARGLLAAVMCLMHRSRLYGYLLVAGKAPTDAELTRLVRATSAAEVRRLRTELIERGVLSVTADGILYSRRMVRAARRAAEGREHGRLGGNPALRALTTPQQRPLTPADNTQKTEDRGQTPKAPLVLTDEALAARAGAFLQRYPDIYARCRSGAHYRPREARDFPTALELVSAHQNDERLDGMLEVFLRMPQDGCRGMNRPGTVNQFAHMAPDCDRLLRENGR
jgi:hypothetical protein